jgi:hypothetical protein
MKKVKKFADGGELGSGLGGVAAMIAAGRKKRSSVDELQDMLPSKEGVGRVMRSKMDPEIIAAAANPPLYGAYKYLEKNPELLQKGVDTIKNARMPELPRSYDKEAGMKKGGTVKKMAKGGSTSSASKRGDGCCVKGKTKGRFV